MIFFWHRFDFGKCFGVSSNHWAGRHWLLGWFPLDLLDLFAVEGTLKSLLQHHSSKVSIFWCSDFFMVQLSHPHMTTGKTIALTIWTFAGKVMSLLFNTLSRFVIACLPRGKESESEVAQSRRTLWEWTIAYQAPPSMGFSMARIPRLLPPWDSPWQEYWSGLPFPSPGDLWPMDQTQVSRIAGRCFNLWATREV